MLEAAIDIARGSRIAVVRMWGDSKAAIVIRDRNGRNAAAVRLNQQQHYEIHRFYESTNPAITGSQTMRVREWLAPQSFANQQAFGNTALSAVARF